ncbi:hypothetical protein [Photobacterium gaetbulicola]|uniref:hypothetical protein n=1 Tax=Photobacterium gaetbulicola TaxID=1295392 RepID=UPI0012E02F59|nr:hypothetical protein [Photobacterium gaetbulicola]
MISILTFLGFHCSNLTASEIEPLSPYSLIVWDGGEHKLLKNNRLVITNLNGTNSSYNLSSTGVQDSGGVISGSFHSTVQANNGYYIVLGGSIHHSPAVKSIDGIILSSTHERLHSSSFFDTEYISSFLSDIKNLADEQTVNNNGPFNIKTSFEAISSLGEDNLNNSLAHHFIDKTRKTLNRLPVPLDSLTNRGNTFMRTTENARGH